jgi:NADPH:quinone reductase-like Zn-dependent oxidoreductase
MPENTALWIRAKRGPLTVGPAPYTAPRADEIVVRVRAVAVNPMDRLQQTMGDIFTPWTPYPFVVGSDVAGEVVEVGSGVTQQQVGDRVVGYAAGSDKQRNRAAEGAFQDYAVLLAHMAAPIPDAMPFEDAAVLPPAFRPRLAACSRKTSWR